MEKWIDELRTDEVLPQSAKYFNDLNLIGGFENYVHGYKINNKDYVLRITHSSHRSKDQLCGELEWIEFLYEKGTNVYKPVHSVNNVLVEEIKLKNSSFFIVSFEKALGKSIWRKDYDDDYLISWGRSIGKMHKVTNDFMPSKAEYKRINWHDNQIVTGTFIPDSDIKMKEVLSDTIAHIKTLPVDKNSYGLIHTDIHSGNMICDKQKNLKIIDFDDSAYMHFISDLTIAVYYGTWHLNHDPELRADYAKKIFNKILEGYRQEFLLAKMWLAEIPHFLKLRDITLYCVFYQKIKPEDMSESTKVFLRSIKNRVENDLPVIDIDFTKF